MCKSLMAAVSIVVSLAAACTLSACAAMGGHATPEVVTPVSLVGAEGPGAGIGTITLKQEAGGVALVARLKGLPPGEHGMHLHANGSCATTPNAEGAPTPAGGAGGHYDPAHTGHHAGPMGDGHLGDLPLLHVDASGAANETLHVTRFRTVSEFSGHAIVIHAHGDNYSDAPAPLGGGGGRIACGVTP